MPHVPFRLSHLSLLFVVAALVAAILTQALPPLARTGTLLAVLITVGALALGAGILAEARKRRRGGTGPVSAWSVRADVPGHDRASFPLRPVAGDQSPSPEPREPEDREPDDRGPDDEPADDWFGQRTQPEVGVDWAAPTAPPVSASYAPVPSPSESSGSEPSEPSGSEPSESSGSEPPVPSGSEPSESSASEPSEPSGSEPSEPSGSEPPVPSGSEPSVPSGSEPPEPSGSEPSESSEPVPSASEPPPPAPPHTGPVEPPVPARMPGSPNQPWWNEDPDDFRAELLADAGRSVERTPAPAPTSDRPDGP